MDRWSWSLTIHRNSPVIVWVSNQADVGVFPSEAWWLKCDILFSVKFKFKATVEVSKSGEGKKIEKTPERLQNQPETEKRGQRTSKVWFNSFIFLNIHF